ncbi:MAG: glutathione S-transferase family protein [Candidatus Dadabacteria bacterium]|nr:glutathione S-transferase family protein [Candidatus Dadabacteria bacterium]NIS09790.1 glutathione S-transferase family protein [Candidatus Dadabacteria bacterium]NIV41146.1 glutathione S-transferase family protein [Candidatus Dadabacteria bacterium]NIX16231.1 glutathione S-transferase family protein [Candidatus Dadabacteria bacterium]NIY22851.1 glutathione S-transferase family protein [Candidatus Dadabacteria bacterium]
MDLEIIWASGSPYSWSVLLALEIKKLEYKSTLIELLKGDGRAPEFLKLNPRGKVPVLIDGETHIYESQAILSYLDRKYPDIPLFGGSPEENAGIMRIISEYTSYIEPHIMHLISSAFWSDSPNQVSLEQAKQVLFYELSNLEKTLTGNSWLTGEEITAADIVIFPFMQLLKRTEAKLQDAVGNTLMYSHQRFPKMYEWMRRFEALPGYEKTYPPHWEQDKEINHYIS